MERRRDDAVPQKRDPVPAYANRIGGISRLGLLLLIGVVVFHFILSMVPWPWYKTIEPMVWGWMPVSYFSAISLYMVEVIFIVVLGILWLRE